MWRINPNAFSGFKASGKCFFYVNMEWQILFLICVHSFSCNYLVPKHSLYREKCWRKSKITDIKKPLNIGLLKWQLHPKIFLKQMFILGMQIEHLWEAAKNMLFFVLWTYILRHNNIYATRLHAKKTQQQEYFIILSHLMLKVLSKVFTISLFSQYESFYKAWKIKCHACPYPINSSSYLLAHNY